MTEKREKHGFPTRKCWPHRLCVPSHPEFHPFQCLKRTKTNRAKRLAIPNRTTWSFNTCYTCHYRESKTARWSFTTKRPYVFHSVTTHSRKTSEGHSLMTVKSVFSVSLLKFPCTSFLQYSWLTNKNAIVEDLRDGSALKSSLRLDFSFQHANQRVQLPVMLAPAWGKAGDPNPLTF